MKRILTLTLISLLAAVFARADTPLSIGYYGSIPCCGGPCWDDELPATLIATNGTFTLTNTGGTGKVLSSFIQAADNAHGSTHLLYNYSVDMSGIVSPGQNHCVKLLIHFGSPHSCAADVLVFTNAGGVALTSAVKAPYGDVTCQFGPCLSTGNITDPIELLTDAQPKIGTVTIIDDFTNPASGQTNETRISVTAVVPDIPPNWAYLPQFPPIYTLQGYLNIVGTNQTATNIPPLTPASNGMYDFTIQLVDAFSNGLPVSTVVTQTVPVINGLFNLPIPSEPGAYTGPTRWANIGVRASGGSGGINGNLSPLPITPTPQALYAFSAGVVADIAPNQAVLSLNGITGNATISGSGGIQVTLNGDGRTINISQVGSPSDRNIKTDFTDVQPADILAKLSALSIQSWRYTNEPAGIRHLGPMAQDFQAAFGLGSDDKTIGIVDEGGVALTAIQALNQQLEKKDAEIKALQQRLEKLEKLVQPKDDSRQAAAGKESPP